MTPRICIVCGHPITTGSAPVVDAHLDGPAQVNDSAHPECAVGYARFCRWNEALRAGRRVQIAGDFGHIADDMSTTATYVDATPLSSARHDDMPTSASWQPTLLEVGT